jgi:ferritin-like metal-binding protein YciE
MNDTSLQDLFVEELRDIYHAERQLVRALPKMAKAASSPELREALESHLAETEEHVARLEQAFGMLDETAKTKTCAGMLGIVEEGSDLIKQNGKGSALDAGIIAGAQRAEHYEIAAYGSVMSWAKALGHSNVAELLSSTLEEEKAADAKLSELAEAGINEAAASGANGDMEEEAGRRARNGGRMSVGGNGRMRASAKGRPVAARK